MKTGCFLSPFIDTLDAKVCIFNLQSISKLSVVGFQPIAPERALRSRAGSEHDFSLVNCAILFGAMRRNRQARPDPMLRPVEVGLAVSRYHHLDRVETGSAGMANETRSSRIAGPKCAE
jgi:hypothetical protein